MTRGLMPTADVARPRTLDTAAVECHWAAWMETAALRHLERARHFALRHNALAAKGRVGDRHGREQHLRVRMLGLTLYRLACSDLDDLAQVHHRHAIRHVQDHV